MADEHDPVSGQSDPSLEALREILIRRDRARIDELEAELDELAGRVTDKDALAATISPVLGEAIRRQIRDAREEMIEALYPLIGQLVVRAVQEAVRDLARTVDAQMRRSFDLRAIWWRIRARLGGASAAETSLRTALPFQVSEVFLIHRETGLLLWHASQEPEAARDSDLVGSMLTAIRDFAQDAFGRGGEGQLEEIEYGDERILLEATRHAYLAVVVDGVEPPGFRVDMRERIVEVEHRYASILADYDGNAAPLAAVESNLSPLMAAPEPPKMSRPQRLFLAGAGSLAVLCLVAACLASLWGFGAFRSTPTPMPVAVQPTATLTPSPSPSPTPTPTWTPTSTATPSPSPSPTDTPAPTSTSTPTATATPTPTWTPAPVTGVMIGNAWLREEPGADAARLGVVAGRGTEVTILAVTGEWCQVRLSRSPGVEATGWVPLRWLRTLDPIPERIASPTAVP